MKQYTSKSAFGQALWSMTRVMGIACLCVSSQGCGQGKPEASAFGGIEQLSRLQASLDHILQLLERSSDPGTSTEMQSELDTLRGLADASGGIPPVQTKLTRIISILSEGDGTISPQQGDDVKAEILAIRQLLDAGVDPDALRAAETAAATGGATPPSPGPGMPGPPGAGPPGLGGGAPPGPSSADMQLEMDHQKRKAEEAFWRARAKAARLAVEQTSVAYDQAMALRPGPGMPPNQVDQAQAAAKAAKDAAEKAQKDLQEEARRAGALPGWLR